MANTVFVIMFVVFIAILVGCGFYAKRWVSEAADYVLAGREVSTFINMMGVIAIGFAGTTVALAPGFAIQMGLKTSLAWGLIYGVCGLLLYGVLWGKFVRLNGAQTLPEFLEMRYSAKIRPVVAVTSVIGMCGILANNIVSCVSSIVGYTGWNTTMVTLIVFAVILCFTFISGLWAATITDFFQVCLGVIAVPLMLTLLANRYGGFDAIAANWFGNDFMNVGIGGQTGLNLAMQLEQKGVLKECQVELLGTDSDSIRRAEDREQFKELCQSIGEPVIPSQITYNLEEAKAAAAAIGYPVVLRPAFTLGGTGGGFADDEAQLVELGMQAFKLSPIHQVLIEKSVKGYKEIEFEVMRDASDRAITICGMENIDPVGVHTGDSAVVAPIMTLSDHDMKMLNDSAIKIIRALKIQGGCNVQFALNPKTSEYFLIEINPRVSRSSALASKASGYPIARVTAKVAVGMNLDEIAVANTTAAFEPSLDYVVAKLPRFPFDKFSTAANTLGTQMKATGEVMGIGSTLEECLLKSVRSLEIGAQHLWLPKFQNMTKAELTEYLHQFRDDGLFAVAQLLRLGASVDEVAALTMITPYFLETIRGIVDMEQTLCAHKGDGETLKRAKQMGFCDPYIARLWGVREEDVYAQRVQLGLYPAYKMVDTSHTGAYIPYFYSTYAPGAKSEARRSDKKKVVVLGAGPIRSDRAWSLTTPPSTRCRPSGARATRPSSSTTTPRRSPPTTRPPISCISSPSRPRMS